MGAENETNPGCGTRFAVDLRRQFEGLAEGASHSPGPLGAGAAASATRYRWLAIVGVITAVIATGVALTLLVARSGTGPNRQLAVASPTAVQSSPGARGAIDNRQGGPTFPDVTEISAVAIDATGRPWFSGSRGRGKQPFIAYLDGSRWVQIPVPADEKYLGPVTVLSTDDLWAAATRGFVHWDGTAWQTTPVSWVDVDGGIVGIGEMAALSTNDIWAVGRQKGELYKSPGDGPGEHTVGYRPLTMHWDGTAWVAVKVPAMPGRSSALAAVSARSGETWAVGSYAVKVGEEAQPDALPREIIQNGPIALRWDGAHWVDMAAPNPGARGTALNDVLVLARNDVWVLGETSHGDESAAHDETVTTYLAHWDGTTWEQIRTPRGDSWGIFWTITGTADGDIWLGGTGNYGFGYAEAVHWDGAHWAIYPPKMFGERSSGTGDIGSGDPQVVALSPTDVWFDPGFTRFWVDRSQPADPALFHWDGHSWTKVVAPL
jgi:hypothetical protein